MGQILTIGTFMEQISDVYRHHRHQRISSVAAGLMHSQQSASTSTSSTRSCSR